MSGYFGRLMIQVVLICSPGAQDAEISHGGHQFLPYREDGLWLVCVPENVAQHLCWNEGFRVFRAKDPSAVAMVRRVDCPSPTEVGDPEFLPMRQPRRSLSPWRPMLRPNHFALTDHMPPWFSISKT